MSLVLDDLVHLICSTTALCCICIILPLHCLCKTGPLLTLLSSLAPFTPPTIQSAEALTASRHAHGVKLSRGEGVQRWRTGREHAMRQERLGCGKKKGWWEGWKECGGGGVHDREEILSRRIPAQHFLSSASFVPLQPLSCFRPLHL